MDHICTFYNHQRGIKIIKSIQDSDTGEVKSTAEHEFSDINCSVPNDLMLPVCHCCGGTINDIPYVADGIDNLLCVC